MSDEGDEPESTAVDEIDSFDCDLMELGEAAELCGEGAFFEDAGPWAGLGEKRGGLGWFEAAEVGACDGAEVPDEGGFVESHGGDLGLGSKPWTGGGDEAWDGHVSGQDESADEEDRGENGRGDGGGAQDNSGGDRLLVELDGEPDGEQGECGERVVGQLGADDGEDDEHEGGSPHQGNRLRVPLLPWPDPEQMAEQGNGPREETRDQGDEVEGE